MFFLKSDLKAGVERALTGFAAGVMVAASIWSLIVPAIDQSASKGRWAFLPAFIGFWVGVLFLLLLDHAIPHLHRSIDQADQTEGPKSKLNRTIMMVLAVTLHNIPRRDGCGSSLCRSVFRIGKYHLGWRSGIGTWYRHSEFPGRGNHIHAPLR